MQILVGFISGYVTFYVGAYLVGQYFKRVRGIDITWNDRAFNMTCIAAALISAIISIPLIVLVGRIFHD